MAVVIKVGETESVSVGVGEKVYIQGDPGFSPTIEVSDITGGHRLTITDINGDKTVDVMNGQKGEQGPKGDPGEVTQAEFDALADAVSRQESDIEGKQDAPANAGAAGQVLGLDSSLNPVWVNQSYNDLSNKPSIEGVTLSGNKTASDLGLALASDVPAKTSDLTNDSGFVNAAGAAAASPVQSVNGMTGAVTIPAATDAQVTTAVNTWLGENVAQETGYVIDASLTMSNAAPPASAVGGLTSAIEQLGFTDAMKAALLECFQHVAWVDGDGSQYYQDLYDALNGLKFSITNDLVNVTNSNTATMVAAGGSYSATLSSVSAAALSCADVSITMGGVDITSTAYNAGIISIAEVTGAVVISAKVAEGYTLYDYIKQTGNLQSNGSIITDIAMSTDYTFETAFQYNSSNQYPIPVLGVRYGTGKKEFALFVTPNTGKLGYWFNGTDTATSITNLVNNQKNSIVVTPVGKSSEYPNNATITSNEVEYNTTSTSTDVTFDPWLAFFGYGQSASTSGTSANIGLQIAETTIKNTSGVVIHDLVPAYNGQYYGLCDVAANKFYYSTNSYSSFLCGNWG